MENNQIEAPVKLPRIAITFCTQCKWMLRAAYYAQELLSTFGTGIGEISLIPATGGLFYIELTQKRDADQTLSTSTIWDRKVDGGFPETKILKQRLRDHIDPDRNLGHSDTPSSKATSSAKKSNDGSAPPVVQDKDENCEDCR